MGDYIQKIENDISIDQAIGRLRSRIENYRLRHLYTTANAVWIAIKSAIAAVILMFVEFLILDPISPDLFVLVFFVVDALIMIGAVMEFRKGLRGKPRKGSKQNS